jgi:hypothetical protein
MAADHAIKPGCTVGQNQTAKGQQERGGDDLRAGSADQRRHAAQQTPGQVGGEAVGQRRQQHGDDRPAAAAGLEIGLVGGEQEHAGETDDQTGGARSAEAFALARTRRSGR